MAAARAQRASGSALTCLGSFAARRPPSQGNTTAADADMDGTRSAATSLGLGSSVSAQGAKRSSPTPSTRDTS